MRMLLLCILPFTAALFAGILPNGRARPIALIRLALLVGTALVHSALVASIWVTPAPGILAGWLAVDALGLIVLSVTSAVFLATAIYTVGYMQRESPRGGRLFVSAMLVFLGATTIVALSQHLALLWVGMEATTLAVAPLIFHRHDRRSLEAVWKYLLISSVGIALALLGTFFLSSAQGEGTGRPLMLPDLLDHARALHPAWLRAAFLFLLVGFGTKMGLAPMHTWKPDTYGEAPSLISGLMAGALTSCAFLGVARITEIVMAAGLGQFAQPVLIGFGLLSLAVAAVFVIGQSDVKRLLAYSSVEHMGLLVLGLGLGGVGAYGSMLHVLNNGLTKGWMFLVAGNIVLVSGSSAAAANKGLVRTIPVSGTLLVLGLFAVTGSPPFGLFLSEFTILRAAVAGGHIWIAATMLLLLAVIFVGMAMLILGMALGSPEPGVTPVRESRWLIVGPVALAAIVLLLGLYIPGPLNETLARAAVALGGTVP
ncbi:MAG TPA: proton-conducting transporter membrane subunit [Gemmatimonadaceae bacterium]|nr:proton-conducting transporter membrane subunit [Gemmatimonadaceae bacterium]